MIADYNLYDIFETSFCLYPPFTFSAEPGKTYVFRCQTDGVSIWHKFWIESLPASNVVVGPIYHAPGLALDQFATNNPAPYAFNEERKAPDARPVVEEKSR
jgi:hypothetical protein